MTEPFVPRGYVPLMKAIQRLVIQLGGTLIIHVSRDAKELYALETRAREHDALVVARTKYRSGRSLVPSLSAQARSVLPPRPWGTHKEVDRLRVLRHQAASLDRLKKLVTYRVRQELGDGDAQAEALGSLGFIRPIPANSWRTDNGAVAIARGENLLSQPMYEPRLLGTPMITEATLTRWLELMATMRSQFDGLAAAEPDGTGPLVTDGNAAAAEAAVVHPRALPVHRRADVLQPKVNEWMHQEAASERVSEAYLSRTDGIKRCMAALNCTRDVARAAYASLPEDFKQPRGRPAKRET